VLWLEIGGDSSGGSGRSLALDRPAAAILTKDAVPDSHLARPVLAVDDEDATRSDGDVIDVGSGPTGPVHVMQDDPAFGFESREYLTGPALTIEPSLPCVQLLLLRGEHTARFCYLPLQPVNLLLCTPTYRHGHPPGTTTSESWAMSSSRVTSHLSWFCQLSW
jgi:hypothetical protein